MKSLFKSSNKSQASFHKHAESSDHSSHQQDPAYTQSQLYSGAQSQSQPQQPQQHQHHQVQADEHYYTENPPTLPAHVSGRSQSSRGVPGPGTVYAQDQHQHNAPVNSPLPPTITIPQSNFGPTQSTRVDREQKKSKRSIFGLGSRDKKEDREYAGDRRSGVGRNSSVLRKGSQQQYPQSPRSPQDHDTHQFQPPPATELRTDQYQQDAAGEGAATGADQQYEQYYRSSNQYDSPQSQHTHQSIRYPIEDEELAEELPSAARHNQQSSSQSRTIPYQLHHQPNSAASSANYLPQRVLQTLDPNHPLRPPSQASLGPPSPLVGQSDSRPPTSDTQSRYSVPINTQTQPSQDKTYQRQPSQDQLDSMLRNDGSNGTTRQHRDEERHTHYQSQQDPRVRTQGHEQGRNTPPPKYRDDFSNLDFHQLLQKHEELIGKYSKVKRYYFEREAQVTQLQNTVATQRLSMSKTALDDAQYASRFDRLNGAIQNLSFNIRKDWRRVPNWLAPVCNKDAHSVGTKEMTAVGRACITRWLFEFLFERVFHPGIDPSLSIQLKNIERSLRRSHHGAVVTAEQQDDLMTKVTTWRLTTIEGLVGVLSSRQCEVYTDNLTNNLTKQLTDHIRSHLTEPAPPGLADNLFTIVGQAVNICSNIPLESRDVYVEYFLPASHSNENYMRFEAGMTVLQSPGSAPSDHYNIGGSDDDDLVSSSSMTESTIQSQADLEAQIREASAKGTSTNPVMGSAQNAGRNESVSSSNAGQVQSQVQQQLNTAPSREAKKSSFLGGLVNKKLSPSVSAPIAASASSNTTLIEHSKAADGPGIATGEYNIQSLFNGSTDGKIRFAAFLAVEVRGRTVLPSPSSTREAGKETAGSAGADTKAESAGAGIGAQQGESNSKTETGSIKGGVNVLIKAPVYCFE